MAALEAARAALRAELAREPRRAIASMQEEHGLRDHDAILALLDLHRVPRGHVYRTLFEHLRAQLLVRVPTLPPDRYGAAPTPTVSVVPAPSP
jgi:hypothetical protein